jgi:hypothetical protein
MHFNSILPSGPVSCETCLTFSYSHQNLVRISCFSLCTSIAHLCLLNRQLTQPNEVSHEGTESWICSAKLKRSHTKNTGPTTEQIWGDSCARHECVWRSRYTAPLTLILGKWWASRPGRFNPLGQSRQNPPNKTLDGPQSGGRGDG